MSNQASLGDIPDNSETQERKSKERENDWETSPLGNYCEIVTGNNFSSEKYIESGIPLIRISNLGNGTISKDDLVNLPKDELDDLDQKYILEKGDTLIAMSGATTGKLGVIREEDSPSILNQRIGKFKPNSGLNKIFLRFVVESHEYQRYVNAHAKGGAQPNISATDLKNIDIPHPSEDEQRRIASVLYNVDRAISKTEEIIEQTQRVKKGLMQDLFTEGYYDHETVEGNHRWEKVPEDWRFIPLNKVVTTNPRYDKPDREIAYIEMDAVNEDLPHPDYIGRRNPQDSSGRRFKEKDTLFARITPCTENGKICFVDNIETDLGIASTELAVLSPDQDEILPKFLYHFTRTHRVRDYAISRMRGSTGRQRVPFSVFKKELYIPLPEKEEQEKIVEALDGLDQKKTKLRENKEQLRRLKKGLMQDLLTGEIRTHESIKVLDEVIEVEG